VIFVDANVFLRFFVAPGTPQDRTMALQVAELFRRVRDEEEKIMTSEAVIAEVAFIATSKTHYGMTRGDVVDLLKSVLQLSACSLSAKSTCLLALDVWVAHPKLSFPDALGAAYSEDMNVELATFDERLIRLPDVIPYVFPTGAKNGNGTTGT
jgi:predicted nucleic acid-binding protein